VPPRRYDIAARVLARAVAEPGDGSAADRATAVAREEGRLIGAARRSGGRMSARRSLDAAAEVLSELGYEPQSQASCVQLRNCPFHAVVDVAPALVCGLNDALIGGILDGLGASESVGAALDGVAPNCCVTVAKR
jgi:predicted ArsR family transcriptional regulator